MVDLSGFYQLFSVINANLIRRAFGALISRPIAMLSQCCRAGEELSYPGLLAGLRASLLQP